MLMTRVPVAVCTATWSPELVFWIRASSTGLRWPLFCSAARYGEAAAEFDAVSACCQEAAWPPSPRVAISSARLPWLPVARPYLPVGALPRFFADTLAPLEVLVARLRLAVASVMPPDWDTIQSNAWLAFMLAPVREEISCAHRFSLMLPLTCHWLRNWLAICWVRSGLD